MQLHEWHSNSRQLHELWVKKGIVPDENPEDFNRENFPFKVLGMAWDNSKDLLYFDVRNLLSFTSKPIETKRFLLQVLGRIFDPIGILGPFTVRIKCLIQKIWLSQIDWDEPLPEDLSSEWRKWCEELPQMAEFSISRYLFMHSNINVENLELHCFSDASVKAYGTVAYLRFTTENKEIKTSFVSSKNRVAPLKSLTLPRLELMGALLSVKLVSNILKALKLRIPCYFWTDSTITYFCIQKQPEAFKPFVRNRVEKIQKLSSPQDWHYCPGVDNPADLVSRGTKISKLINETIWTQGPQWLQLPHELWPRLDIKETIDENKLEYRKGSGDIHQLECTIEKSADDLFDISKYSKLEKVLRVTAWTTRFIRKLRKTSDIQGTLTAEELQEAENFWIRSEQKKFFAEEYKSLKEGNSVGKISPLYNFLPYIDEKEIMRLRGRLEFSDFSLDNKHPIILPKNSRLTILIVSKEHEKIMHGGIAATLAKVRSRFWIPKGRQLVKKALKGCIICQKYLAKPADQMTAPLPKDRIQESPPFAVCGIDFAGPVYVKSSKDIRKFYIVLFVCAVTRAVHLELVSDMSTESFLLAFRRFLSRRVNCVIFYSDNAKTFKRTKKELENFSKVLKDDKFKNFIAKERIHWKFIIERAPWWGGFYERLVRSVKECLRKIVGKALLTFEEMSTLLVEVESVLNSRPLSYVYNDNDEPQPLTPMHFLNIGQTDLKYPLTFARIIGSETTRETLLKRKRYQELLLKQLWWKWKQQYLLDLRTAHFLKNPQLQPELKVGDVVLVEGDNKNKLLWKLGRIIKIIPGRDGKVRSFELKTGNGTLKRTVQHLYPPEL